MIFKDFYAGKDDNDRRLDKVIRIFLPSQPLSSIYKLLRKGLIKLNDKKATPDYRIKTGDKISIADFIFESSSENTVNSGKNQNKTVTQNLQLPPVVFENQHIIIFNKPQNLSVHGDNSLEEIYSVFYKNNNSQNSLSFKPGPLHRIDRMTSGLVAFSKSLEGARWFSDAIKNHSLHKKYYALLEGKVLQEEEWIDYIKAPEDNQKTFHTVEIAATQKDEEFKKAISFIKPICSGNFKNKELTLVQVEIKTGRQHQIRAQSSFHGHPLFGDTAYGGEENDSKAFFLHAAELILPKDNPLELPTTIKADLPKSFLNFLVKTCSMEFSDI